jgi:hypothetical protein
MENLRQHCIPLEIFDSVAESYDGFLDMRRHLMAQKLQKYFSLL